MELASPGVHQALAFVAALNRYGYRPTPDELDAYVDKPYPFRGMIADIVNSVWAYETFNALGLRETICEYLLRVLWIRLEGDRLAVTDCGRHVLLALEEGANAVDGPVEVTLDPQDPTVLSRVVRRLADLGKALLVDPYIRLEQFLLVMEYTEIDRILMTDAVKSSERQELKHALAGLQAPRRIEVRMAKKEEIHDRYVIPPQGPVTFR
jgi:hypothetical protein